MKKIFYISLIAVLVLLVVVVSCQLSVTTPEVPVLKLPVDKAEDVSLTPSFYWGLDDGKKDDTLYSLKVYRLTTGGTETVFQKTGLSEKDYKLTHELMPSENYFWDITYVTEKGDIVKSPLSYFDTLALPELEFKIPSSKVFEGKTLNVDLKSFLNGLKGRDVNFCLISGPGKITDGVYVFNPQYEESGSYIVEVCANDGLRETSQQFEVTVLDTYRPMQVKNLQEDFEIKEGDLFSVNLKEKIDNPEANLLTYNIVEGPGEIRNGVYYFTPDFTQQGKEFVKIKIEDPATEIDVNFHIIISDVNQIPSLGIIPIQTVKENEKLVFNLKEYTNDPDNDALIFEKIQGPGELTAEGIYRFEPDFDSEKDYFVKFSISDGKDISEDKFSVIVENVNRKPVELKKLSTEQIIAENEELSIDLGGCFEDPDDDEIIFSLISGPGEIRNGVYYYLPDYDSDSSTSISIEISDNTDKIIKAYDITIQDVNRAPKIEVKNNADFRDTFSLSWKASDSDNDELLYDVYFSEKEPPELIAENLKTSEWKPADSGIVLEPFKKYYWQVVVKDEKGLQTKSEIHSVEFGNKAPEKPLLTTKIDTEKVVGMPFTIEWISSDKDDGQALKYDFYIGREKDNLKIVAENIENESYTVSGLEGGQKYFWKICSKDPYDAVTESDTYFFTTNQPPHGAVDPGIKNESINVSSTDTTLSWDLPSNPDNDTITYDLYLGTVSSQMKLIGNNLSEKHFKLSGLAGNKQFFWQVISKDEHGAETAGPVWTFATGFGPGAVEWEFKVNYDIRSSPAISDDGTIYFGADDDYLYAIDREGNFIWKFDCGNVVFPSPSIGSDGTVYVATGNKYIYAIDSNGTERWKKEIQGACYSSPAVDKKGTVYIGDSTGALHALSSDGRELWSYMTKDEIRSSPAVGYSGTVYFGSDDGFVYALNNDGTLKWKFETNNFVRSSPALDENENIYIGSFDGSIYALNKNGALIWKTDMGAELRGSPSIYLDGTIYIGAFDGTLNALNPDGSLRWSYKIEEGPFWSSSPAIGEDGTVYIGTWEKKVLAIGPDGKKKWIFEADDYIKSSPVVDTDGSLYIGTYGAKLYSIATDSMGISEESPWPMFRKDQKHTATQ